MHFISPNSILGRWLAFLLDALLISIAWAICSLPVITMGASTAALNKVAMNWMRDRSGCTLGDFFRAFKENWKTGTGVWLILLIPLLFILFNAYATWIALVQTSQAARWMILISAVLWLAVAIYAFALQAIFENSPMRTVMNAMRIAFCNIFKTVILLVIFAASIAMFIIFPLGAVFYTPICVFLAARPIWSVFKKVIEMPEVTVTNQNEIEDEGE